VRVQRARAADDLLVSRVTASEVDPNRDRFLAFVGDDDALAGLGRVGVALGGRRAGLCLAFLGLGGSPLLAPFVGLLLARLSASGGALLGSLRRLRLAGLAR